VKPNLCAQTVTKTLTTTKTGETNPLPTQGNEKEMAVKKTKKKVLTNPQSELEEAREMLAVMKDNLKQANAELRENGLMWLTTICNSHGKFTEVRRVNPALRVQAAAVKAINSLKKQIAVLEEEAAAKLKQEKEDEEFKEFEQFQ
jgi:hypothetical protein